ncbi:MAG TPA: lytic murein transglycosylase [Stellaceae bacterium]|nr:lytic murein transglycosylase [Stellaceae bacterium]
MRWLVFALGLLFCATNASAQSADFSTWLQGMRQDALAQGISAATFDQAFTGVQPIPRVIELDQKQPESTLTFQEYMDRVVTQKRRDDAHQHYLDNQALLEQVAQRYQVPARYIVALWGIETNFGERIGNYPIIASLATLAYDGRRAAFFRKELINALKIVQDDHVDPSTMIGSWAGAMGQSQFMPSSYLRFAVSYTGNGAPDIWNKPDDVFASIANYLATSGWNPNHGLGWQVSAPPGIDPSLVGMPPKRTLAEWAALGIKRSDGSPLMNNPTESTMRAALLQPGGSDGPSFLVTDNFSVILRWNNSSYFALAVGYLAESVK